MAWRENASVVPRQCTIVAIHDRVHVTQSSGDEPRPRDDTTPFPDQTAPKQANAPWLSNETTTALRAVKRFMQ
jgi:hypothetical protein